VSNIYLQRGEQFAMQTSTIHGIAAIVGALVGGGADALGASGLVSAVIGLVVSGLTAIFLPGHDPAPIVAGAQNIVSAIQSHADDVTKAAESAKTAAETVSAEAPKIAAEAEKVTAQVQSLAPIVQTVAMATNKPGVTAVVGQAETVLDAIAEGLTAQTAKPAD
jgi:protein involved in polysaccharide export with SLBB domain